MSEQNKARMVRDEHRTGDRPSQEEKFGNRGHVTIAQPGKPSERPAPKPPAAEQEKH